MISTDLLYPIQANPLIAIPLKLIDFAVKFHHFRVNVTVAALLQGQASILMQERHLTAPFAFHNHPQ